MKSENKCEKLEKQFNPNFYHGTNIYEHLTIFFRTFIHFQMATLKLVQWLLVCTFRFCAFLSVQQTLHVVTD